VKRKKTEGDEDSGFSNLTQSQSQKPPASNWRSASLSVSTHRSFRSSSSLETILEEDQTNVPLIPPSIPYHQYQHNEDCQEQKKYAFTTTKSLKTNKSTTGLSSSLWSCSWSWSCNVKTDTTSIRIIRPSRVTALFQTRTTVIVLATLASLGRNSGLGVAFDVAEYQFSEWRLTTGRIIEIVQ
jgi:hypothetical protein